MSETPAAARLNSLDQFRGYTVAGMFVVNFLGGLAVTPAILKHHNSYCSYADTIMPQFFFAAGFALRLVMLKMLAGGATHAAVMGRGVRRALGLLVFGLILYHLDGDFGKWQEIVEKGWSGFWQESFRRNAFQALVHIAVTTLWILPVICRGWPARVIFAALSAGLHIWLSHDFWYETLHRWHVIDGGLLGFLTWTVPMIAGSLAYDAIRTPRPSFGRLITWGAAVMVAGYGLSCLTAGGHLAPPPFFPPVMPVDMWTMSQRAGSLSYLLFSAGWSLALYAIFRRLCDGHGWSLTVFRDLGRNALAAYVLHFMVMDAVLKFCPRDSPLWWALLMCALHFGIIWWWVRWLNGRGLFLRL